MNNMINLIFYSILGQPLVVWVGLAAWVFVLVAGLLGFLVGKGKAKINWHINIARLAIVLALLHGLAAIFVVLK